MAKLLTPIQVQNCIDFVQTIVSNNGYLQIRDITKALAKEFGISYLQASPMVQFLRRKGFLYREGTEFKIDIPLNRGELYFDWKKSFKGCVTFGVDFDDTCVVNKYPKVGETVIQAPTVLKQIENSGHLIVLYTIRSVDSIQKAMEWFKEYDIELYGVNHNPDQGAWFDSRKVWADYYIDDRNIGTPMTKQLVDGTYKSVVDWIAIKEILTDKGLLF